jgi:hypothetical protein
MFLLMFGQIIIYYKPNVITSCMLRISSLRYHFQDKNGNFPSYLFTYLVLPVVFYTKTHLCLFILKKN